MVRNLNKSRLFARGFTFLEVVIVIAILSIIVATVLPPLMNFRKNSTLNSEVQEVMTLINKARMSAISSKDDQQFGIHFEAGKVVLFQGVTYTPGAATNEEHILDAAITGITTINGGGSELLFAKIIGSTSQNATTTLLIVGTTASTTILVRQSGIVTVN